MNSQPLTLSEFSALLEPGAFAPHDSLAIAVSGGADSMALLLLLNEYAKTHQRKLYALSVDHRLRKESADECRQVAAWCEKLGVAHNTLVWEHDNISGGVQEQARDARYQLMLDWCRAHRIPHLFTAHHLDDQIETFLFRLMRGSGLEGLSAMLPVSVRQGIALHRPLLAVPKSRLIATLKARSQDHLEDPSNSNAAYTRNAMRQHLSSLDDATKERFSQLTIFFTKFRNLLKNNINNSMSECFALHEAGFGRLSIRPFLEQSAVMKRRIAERICHLVSGDFTPIRREKITRMVEALSAPKPGGKTMLHGVAFQYVAKDNIWIAAREKKKIAPAAPISEHPVLWDGRYAVSCNMPGYHIGALGTESRDFADALIKAGIPKSAWHALPAVRYLEECVHVPHIGYAGQTHAAPGLSLGVSLEYIPLKSLAGVRDFAHNEELTHKYKGERLSA